MKELFLQSPPSRAAWIEIGVGGLNRIIVQSPPSRAAWIEIFSSRAFRAFFRSPPSRAAWIEITLRLLLHLRLRVAAFTGGVD